MQCKCAVCASTIRVFVTQPQFMLCEYCALSCAQFCYAFSLIDLFETFNQIRHVQPEFIDTKAVRKTIAERLGVVI